MNELGNAVLGSLLYAGTGTGLLVAGWAAWDAATPGKLGELVMGKPPLKETFSNDPDRIHGVGGVDTAKRTEAQPSVNAAAVAATGLVSTALVVFTALWRTNQDSIWTSLGWAIIFGLFGIALQIVLFKLMDAVTPGKLGDVICAHHTFHPATLLVVASTLSSAAIVCVAIA